MWKNTLSTGLTDVLQSASCVPAILGFIKPLTKHMRPKRIHEKLDSETPAPLILKPTGEAVVKLLCYIFYLGYLHMESYIYKSSTM